MASKFFHLIFSDKSTNYLSTIARKPLADSANFSKSHERIQKRVFESYILVLNAAGVTLFWHILPQSFQWLPATPFVWILVASKSYDGTTHFLNIFYLQ